MLARSNYRAFPNAAPTLAALAGAGVLGFLVYAYPFAVFAFSASLALFALAAWLIMRRLHLELWQVLVLTVLTGYIVFNYGFANLTVHAGGMPIIVGHALMFGALALAVVTRGSALIKVIREPTVLALLALFLLSLLHLALDIPQHGFYAVRDSSLFLEGVFLLLGLLWAREERNLNTLLKWFFLIFLANLLYSLSFPWGESLRSWSPQSGIFRAVPVFGFYSHTYLYLLSGALFCLWLGRYAVKWPRWILLLLAVAQLFGLTIHQARSMYVGIVIVLIVLLLLGELRKWAKITVTLSLGLVALLLVTSFAGIELRGRVGPASFSFLQDHVRSLSGVPGSPGVGTIYHRLEWYNEVWERARSTTTNLLVGEGFGEPLIDFEIAAGVQVRQPHNTHLSVLARLGLVGLAIWAFFHFLIVRRFVHVLRRRGQLDKKHSDLRLWLFIFYILFMLVTSVQPYLEFSYGAIPFYFLMGFALGIMRWQLAESLVWMKTERH